MILLHVSNGGGRWGQMSSNTCLEKPSIWHASGWGRTHMCLERGKCKVCWMEKAPQDFDEFTRKNPTEDVTDFKIDSDHNCV